jgi:hypothetical protein
MLQRVLKSGQRGRSRGEAREADWRANAGGPGESGAWARCGVRGACTVGAGADGTLKQNKPKINQNKATLIKAFYLFKIIRKSLFNYYF